MNIINLIIDRLHIGSLGCYGNSWITTPNFDRVAASGFLFDQAYVASPELAAQYAALSSGSLGPTIPGGTLVERLKQAGIPTALLTDDPIVDELPWAAEVDDLLRVDAQRSSTVAEEIEETSLAQLFAVAGQWLEQSREPFCLWIHCGSIGHVWDAPIEFRSRYHEEDEPAPTTDATVPIRLLPTGYDPDELLAVTQAYAGQVSLLDVCLGALLEGFEQSSLGDRTMFSVAGLRGFPLGEHRRLGPVDEALYAELVHVPWILKMPDGCGAAARSQALMQSVDHCPTILDALGLPFADEPMQGRSVLPLVRGEADALRDRLILSGIASERAVRTGGWYLRAADGSISTNSTKRDLDAELYVKPDDRWEKNDVADRCPEVVELLANVLDEGQRTTPAQTLAPLADILAAGLE